MRKSDSVKDFKNIFQAIYQGTWITFPKHSFVLDLEHVFVCCSTFWNNNSEESWEITLFTLKYMTNFLHSKRVVSNLPVNNSIKDLTLQRQTLAYVCKLDALKDFAEFMVKHLNHILFLMALQASSFQIKSKRDPGADFFTVNFKNTFF